MKKQVFEYPLNTKIRSYLRFEHVNHQLTNAVHDDHGISLFRPLFGLYEICERIDYRNDLLKDLDKYLMLIQRWQESPEADSIQLEKLKLKLEQHKAELIQPQRMLSQFQEDKFLNSIRQRLTVTGASCNFDLPQLHFWLASTKKERKTQSVQWQNYFLPLAQAIDSILDLIRESNSYQSVTAKDGFYQHINDTPLAMVRVQIDHQQACYPTISGHKNRFAIHMVKFDNQRHFVNDTDIALACCSEP